MSKVILIVIAVVVVLVLLISSGPLQFWRTASPSPSQTPQPTPSPTPATPTPTPTMSTKPISTPPVTPSSTPAPTGKARIFNEKELQDKINALIPLINKSGDANVEYIQVKLEQDRMLVSAKGKAMGIDAQTTDMEISFDGKTVSVEGQVLAMGFSPTLTAVAEIKCEGGKPGLELKSFHTSAALALKLIGITPDDIFQKLNDAIVSRGLTVLCDVESISIRDAKLTLVFNK